MRRAAEAQAKEAQERVKPIADIVAMPEFAKVKAAIENLPNDFMADMNIAPHIMAARAGLNGIAVIAPAPVEDPAPAADA